MRDPELTEALELATRVLKRKRVSKEMRLLAKCLLDLYEADCGFSYEEEKLEELEGLPYQHELAEAFHRGHRKQIEFAQKILAAIWPSI